MSVVELARLIKHGREELKAMIEFSEEVMQSLDRNGDNLVSRTEFAMALAFDTALLDTFRACISSITVRASYRVVSAAARAWAHRCDVVWFIRSRKWHSAFSN